ncbi:beta family protein [Pseudomonas aeruginosa]
MNDQYFPVLKAKKGELDALSNLSQSVLARTTPIIELTKLGGRQLEAAQKWTDTPFKDYIEKCSAEIAKAIPKKQLMLDIFQWPENFLIESGEHILNYAIDQLTEKGILPCPLIGYDRWETPEYKEAIKSIRLGKDQFFSIRLDSVALEDMLDPDYFNEVIEDIVAETNLIPLNTPVIIDLEDITKKSVNDAIETIGRAYEHMRSLGFTYIISVGSSIPTSVNHAVKTPDSSATIFRKEVLAWKGFLQAYPTASLYFGDYGVRNPRAADNIIAPDMNGKIRYTIENSYFIARGHSLRRENKAAQNNVLARAIVESPHYMGENFSWGDYRIMECSKEKFVGNPTTWISIDTNHHISALTTEIYEFASKIAAAATRAAKV